MESFSYNALSMCVSRSPISSEADLFYYLFSSWFDISVVIVYIFSLLIEPIRTVLWQLELLTHLLKFIKMHFYDRNKIFWSDFLLKVVCLFAWILCLLFGFFFPLIFFSFFSKVRFVLCERCVKAEPNADNAMQRTNE